MLNSPLHVSSLGTTQSKDTVLHQDVQTHRVDTLLIDKHEALGLLSRSNGLVADRVLQLDNLLQLRVDETPLRLDELLPLLCRRVEEARVDLTAVSILQSFTAHLRLLVLK